MSGSTNDFHAAAENRQRALGGVTSEPKWLCNTEEGRGS